MCPRAGVGRGHGGGLDHAGMRDDRGLDLERADAVAGRDDHVVVASLVPDVAVLVLAGDVLGVEPVAAEHVDAVLRSAPVPERIVRVGVRAKADLPGLALRHGTIVVVEQRNVPARHRPPHRSRADLHGREVRAQRVALGQAVEVEQRHPELTLEPPDHLGVARLAGDAGEAQLHVREARGDIAGRRHRPERGRGCEEVADAGTSGACRASGRGRSHPCAETPRSARRTATARGCRARCPRSTPTRRWSGRPRRCARRGSTRTRCAPAGSGGRGRCPWPGRWCRTCSRSARPGRPACRASGRRRAPLPRLARTRRRRPARARGRAVRRGGGRPGRGWRRR